VKVLAYTSPARGHLYPVVPILEELQRRGHRIAIRTLTSQLPLMHDRRFGAASISPEIQAMEHDDYRARSPIGKMKRGLAKFGLRAEHEVGDLRAAIEEERPDAILVDAMSWGASAAAEAWGGPWAQWFPYPLPLPSRDVPPFGPGLRPAAGPLGHLRDRAVGPLLLGSLQRASFPKLNAVRAAAGLGPFQAIEDMSPPRP